MTWVEQLMDDACDCVPVDERHGWDATSSLVYAQRNKRGNDDFDVKPVGARTNTRQNLPKQSAVIEAVTMDKGSSRNKLGFGKPVRT